MLLVGTVAVGMPFVLTLYAQQVLGYSAVKFGVGSVVLAAGAAVGAIVAQAAVLKAGFRTVAATGMALMGAGSLLLTQVSVSGSYFGDIFFGLLVFGPGVGLAFVHRHGRGARGRRRARGRDSPRASATPPSRSAERSASPSLTTVAVSRSDDYLAANDGANPLVVLNEGFQSAFLALRRAGRDRRRAGAPAPRPRRGKRRRSGSRPSLFPSRTTKKENQNGKDRDQR